MKKHDINRYFTRVIIAAGLVNAAYWTFDLLKDFMMPPLSAGKWPDLAEIIFTIMLLIVTPLAAFFMAVLVAMLVLMPIKFLLEALINKLKK